MDKNIKIEDSSVWPHDKKLKTLNEFKEHLRNKRVRFSSEASNIFEKCCCAIVSETNFTAEDDVVQLADMVNNALRNNSFFFYVRDMSCGLCRGYTLKH
jgi:hypothetical protein